MYLVTVLIKLMKEEKNEGKKEGRERWGKKEERERRK
jgi:hypothetical protein